MIVVGSVNMDIVVRVSRAPLAGETVTGLSYAVYPGGKGANQAVAAHRAGSKAQFFGCLGRDAYGDQLYQSLLSEGLNIRGVVQTNFATGVAFIVVEDHGQNRITVISGANEHMPTEAFASAFNEPDILLLQLEIPLSVVHAAAVAMRKAGGIVILNPSPVQPELGSVLSLADIVLVNETEAMHLLERSTPINPVNGLAAAQELAAGRQAAVITLGAAGAIWATPERKPELVPGFAVNVVDTTGCGDAFAGVFAAALAAGDSMENAVIRGNAAGALAATQDGAQPSLPLRAAIDTFLAQQF